MIVYLLLDNEDVFIGAYSTEEAAQNRKYDYVSEFGEKFHILPYEL